VKGWPSPVASAIWRQDTPKWLIHKSSSSLLVVQFDAPPRAFDPEARLTPFRRGSPQRSKARVAFQRGVPHPVGIRAGRRE
jgi:hypothetical protein